MEIHADVPDSVAVGKPSPKFTLDATTTVSKDITYLIHTFVGGLKSVEGTVDTKVELRSQQDNFQVPVRFRINKVTIPESDRAFAATATGTAPSRTFHKPGTVRIAVGDLNVTLVGKKADGKRLGPVNSACKLDAHQSPVVASFAVTGTGTATTTGSPASGTSGTGAATGLPASGTSGTGAATGSASAGASALSPSRADATVRGTTAMTGQDTKDLVLLAVGTLVAGGGVFLFGSRLKHRRRG